MTTPEGWYPDPLAEAELRWFDGTAWTDHVTGTGSNVEPEEQISDETIARSAAPAPHPTPSDLPASAADELITGPPAAGPGPLAPTPTDPVTVAASAIETSSTVPADFDPSAYGPPTGSSYAFPPPDELNGGVSDHTPVPSLASSASSINPQPASGPVVVSATAEETATYLTGQLVGAGATVTSHSSAAVTGFVVTRKKPSVLIAILLWFLCVIPMVIYLINASKDVQEPFTIALVPVPDGIRLDPSGVGRGFAAARWASAQAAEVWPAGG